MKARNRKIDKVYIVESLSRDEKTGTSLHGHICSSGKFSSTNTIYWEINSKRELFDKLDIINSESESNQGVVLDIESHGSINGLFLLNGDLVEWYEITEKLRAINITTVMGLVVIFSCCSGAQYLLNGINVLQRIPFYLFFAPDREIYSSKLLKANTEIFDSFLNEEPYPSVVENINKYFSVNEDVKYLAMEPGDLFENCFKKYLKEDCSPSGMVLRVLLCYDEILDISKKTGKPKEDLQKYFMSSILNKDRLKRSFEEFQDNFLCLDLNNSLYDEYEVDFERVYDSSGIEGIYKDFKGF